MKDSMYIYTLYEPFPRVPCHDQSRALPNTQPEKPEPQRFNKYTKQSSSSTQNRELYYIIRKKSKNKVKLHLLT
jgi:hypothetical protein